MQLVSMTSLKLVAYSLIVVINDLEQISYLLQHFKLPQKEKDILKRRRK